MTETRTVTGQSQGEILVQLFNHEIGARDRRLELQQLRDFFVGISTLTDKFRATSWDTEFPPDVKRLIQELNAFLKTCAEYPQLFPARPRGAPPFFVLEYSPVEEDPLRRRALALRRRAITALCSLARYGLLDRVRQCQRRADEQGSLCGRWFFAKKSDSIYCSRDCQTKPTEERKLRKREYAKRSYWEEKERQQRGKLKLRGDEK